jgi:hypothetical protein
MDRRLVAALLSAAAFAIAGSFSPRCGAQPKIGPALIGGGLAVSQAVLLPGYVSTIYYAAHTEKPMPGGWLAGNLIGAAGGLSVGGLLLYSSGSGNSDAEVAGFTVAGGAALLGASFVTVASILQYGRDEMLPMIPVTANGIHFLPDVAPTAWGGTLGLRGQF